MKTSRQLKDLIRNLSKEKDINAQILLRNYMLERLLERISLSEFKDKFILKGGMLIAALVGIDMRSTIDMDATIKSYPVTEKSIKEAFDSILSVPINDGVQIVFIKIEVIRDEDGYNGFRVSLEALMDNARIPLKVDITTGDEITPKEVVYSFDLLLENRTINILAYNIETVLAEKVETIISRGIANTRMRDFYDIYILLKLQNHCIDNELLAKALIATAKKRGSYNLLNDGELILREVFSDASSYNHWKRYQRKNTYANDISWEDIETSAIKLWSLLGIKLKNK
ncbi:nucleotidyl transferase AbiEii/AbiGii toxin family protein [Clostridium sp. Cult2]|uniref:nucleotidyl transferase AbiEii/AbiGii toxin family protein n=1 Tax=Clostridium sp. Cult2 TaxID=2079003 RepID=UPI001F20A948|nr:nucleotidyl transferase AbiEii/AbiGii toxin family protein [Clostridium sp. Cult2]MCF6464508.1 nucleotidyl transferase AbiEii/AbiGii toxin family protein [Clostridium sp. Cult2]